MGEILWKCSPKAAGLRAQAAEEFPLEVVPRCTVSSADYSQCNPQFVLSNGEASDNIPQISCGVAMVTVLRPLSTSELLDRTFHLYRNNFLLFVGITALPQLVPLALHVSTAMMILQRQLGGVGVMVIFTALASYVALEISHAATIIAVSNLHLDRAAGIGSSYALAKASMLRVIGISIAVAIATGIGFLFLIVPGIYLALAWSLSIPVTVIEGGGLNTSTSRSKSLSKGSRGRIFVVAVLMVALTWVVSAIIQFGFLASASVMGLHDPVTRQALTVVLQTAGGFISTSLVGPLLTIALTLIYYDQRVRKEGFDLQLMMATLGSSPEAVAAAAP